MESPYRLTVDEVAALLGSDVRNGLSEQDAQARFAQYGRNELVADKRVPAWRRFIAQFQDVLVVLLIIAAGVSAGLWALERDAGLPYESLAILAVVLLNATMGYLQESRAEAAVAALRAMSAADATVIRGGERRRIPAFDIVPGDIMLLEEGDTIPADARLVESTALQERVITPHMWRGIVFVGMVMALGTLLVLDASLPGGFVDGSGDVPYAQTMAFTTLMLFQMFNVINARSDEDSAFHRLFTNRWLWAAIGGSIVLQLAAVYVPFLQQAFGTAALSARDWLLCATVASSVLWLREVSEILSRASRPA